MSGPEHFECRDCFTVGPLSIRGACEACGSQSVISQELLSLNDEAVFRAMHHQFPAAL